MWCKSTGRNEILRRLRRQNRGAACGNSGAVHSVPCSTTPGRPAQDFSGGCVRRRSQTALAYTPQPGAEPLSVGQYIVMLLLLCIPILNIILIFVWSFSSGRNLNKKNLARAFLIFLAVGFVLVLVGGGALMGVLESIMDGYY